MKTYLGSVGLLLLAVVTGCSKGPAVAPVEGTVTQDGRPLVRAMVEFQPDSGAPSYGETDDDGHYEIQYQVDRMGRSKQGLSPGPQGRSPDLTIYQISSGAYGPAACAQVRLSRFASIT